MAKISLDRWEETTPEPVSQEAIDAHRAIKPWSQYTGPPQDHPECSICGESKSEEEMDDPLGRCEECADAVNVRHALGSHEVVRLRVDTRVPYARGICVVCGCATARGYVHSYAAGCGWLHKRVLDLYRWWREYEGCKSRRRGESIISQMDMLSRETAPPRALEEYYKNRAKLGDPNNTDS